LPAAAGTGVTAGARAGVAAFATVTFSGFAGGAVFSALGACLAAGTAFSLVACALSTPRARDVVAGLRDVRAAGRFVLRAVVFVAAGFGFLAVVFAAGLRAGLDDLPFAAAGDLRAGFTCFLTMVILVR